MAMLLIDGVNEQIPAAYAAASDAEKQQIKQVIEDIFRLVTWRQSVASETEQLRRVVRSLIALMTRFPDVRGLISLRQFLDARIQTLTNIAGNSRTTLN